MSAPYLLLNQSQVFNGLGTLTFNVVTTGNYSVGVQCTVPQAVATGSGAGSNKGLGSGAGGGDSLGFSEGGQSQPTPGGVGEGFGAVANNYPQPFPAGSNQTSGAVVTSGVSIVVNKNGSPIYTAPTLGLQQSQIEFKFSFQAAATDAITVVIASSTASDEGLSGVKSNVYIQQGF